MNSPPKREQAGAGNADPFETEALAKAPPKYTETRSSATITAFPRGLKSRRSTAAIRLAELVRLCQGRRKLGLRVDPHLAAWTLAATLGSVAAGPYKISGRQRFLRWHGLDFASLQHAITRAELGEFDGAELRQIILDIERGHAAHGPGLIASTKLGKLLQVTAAEREEFGLRTIEACDESREARRLRQAEARKQKNRERMRALRGCTPRSIYEGNSLETRKPWEAEGCSRATYFRRRETRLCTHVLLNKGERTDLSHQDPPAVAAIEARATRNVGAGMHAHGAKPIEREASRTARATASGDDDLDDGDLNPAVGKPGPGEPPIPPLTGRAARVVALAERAKALSFPDTEITSSLGLGALALRISNETVPEDVEEIAATIACELLRLLRPYAANDNRIDAIVRRLAA